MKRLVCCPKCGWSLAPPDALWRGLLEELPARTRNALSAAGIRDITTLSHMNERSLLKLPQMGRKGVLWIMAVLEDRGLALDMQGSETP